MSSVECLRELFNERLTAAAVEIFEVFGKTIVDLEEEIDRQRRLLDIAWKPKLKLHRIELPRQHVCKQEEVLCVQERSSSLDQEDPEPPQIKEEQEDLCTSQEGEQLGLKQDTDALMLGPTKEESLHTEDQTKMKMCLNPEKTLHEAEEQSDVKMPIIISVVSEADRDHQLLSNNSHSAESRDQKGDEHGDSGSPRNTKPRQTKTAEPKPKKRPHESKSHTTNEHNSTRSKKRPYNNTGNKSPKCDQVPLKNHQTMCLIPDKTESAPEEQADVQMPVIVSVVSESNGDHQLLSNSSHSAESRDQKGDAHGDSGSPRNTEPRPKKRHLQSKRKSTSLTEKVSFKCDTCGRDFQCKFTLQRHQKTHTGEKPYSCSTCRKRFSRTLNLNNHMKVHMGEKPFSCETCGKGLNSRSGLLIHMRTHTGERPFLCKTCGKSFCDMSGLKKHMRIHTEEKPFTCSTCGKGFRVSHVLKVHMRTHTGEKPYLCKTCGKSFVMKSKLVRHKKIHTGAEPQNGTK